MTMRLSRSVRSLFLASMAACAACGLQDTTPVKPAADVGSPPGAFREQPKGPEYVGPQLAVGREGNLYLLWLAAEWRKSWDILYSRSEDFGATWSQPAISLKPEKATIAAGPRIATGSRDDVYAVWREKDLDTKGRRLRFMRSDDGGAHWDDASKSLRALEDVGFPQLLAEMDGRVYIAWLDRPKGQSSLEVAISYNSGATFGPASTRFTAVFPTSRFGISNPQIASDGEGHLYVVWEEDRSPKDFRVYLNRSLDQGKTWASQPILLDTPEESPHNAHSPRVVVAAKGRVYAVWEQHEKLMVGSIPRGAVGKPGKVIYLNRSLDYGQTWLPRPIRLNESGLEPVASSNAELSGDRNGNVYTVWIESEGPNPKRLLFARSADSGLTWEDPRVRLDLTSPSGGQIVDLRIRNDDAGHVWIVWQQLTSGPKGWDLLMNRSDDAGRTWRKSAASLASLLQQRRNARGLSFQNDGDGHLWVAWDGGPENSREIYVNRSTDFGATWLPREVRVGQR